MLGRIFKSAFSGRRRHSVFPGYCLESLEQRQLLTKGMFPADPVLQSSPGSTGADSLDNLSAENMSGTVDTQGFFDGNNSIATAQFLGTISGDSTDALLMSTYGKVHYTLDRDDYYQITLTRAAFLEIKLSGMKKDADLELLNSSGTVLESSDNAGRESESIRRELSAGTYYLHVEKFGRGKSFYNLTVNTVGNTTATAFNLGTDSSGKTVTSDIGSGDQADYYKFTVTSGRGIEVTLSGLSADADIEVLDAVGTRIGLSSNLNTASERIRLNLGTGTYYVRVTPWPLNTSPFTGYTLTHSATPGNWGTEEGRV